MWKNWNAEREISEEGKSITSNYDASNRSLQGSHPGSFSVEFDGVPGVYSDRSSEAGTGRTTPIDWVTELLSVRDRLEEQKNQDGGLRDSKPRAPSPCEYSELLEMTKIDEPAAIPDPDALKSPGMIKKYADTYELEKYKKNAMIIFNHKDFLGGNDTREGTMEDEVALKTLFETLNFEVEPHTDLPKRRLLQELKKFCSKDFREYGCVCVAILTHGSNYGYLKAFDTRYSEHEVIECFDVQKNPTLCGKPIIILIQACRGKVPATAGNPGTPKKEKDVQWDDDIGYHLPIESDMAIFHSSYVGRASARHPKNGSWFIQTLCEQIRLLAATEDFVSICRAAQQKVALDKEHKTILKKKPAVAKQMPVLTSTLIRRLYLHKYEDVEDEDELSPKEKFEKDRKVQKDRITIAKGAQAIRKLYLNTGKICGCDKYFEYMKKCLRLFIDENPDDEFATYLLTTASGDKDKYEMVNLIRKYLNQNAERFKYSSAVYFERLSCVSTRSDDRDRLVKCCSLT